MHSDSEGEFLAPPESAHEDEVAHRTSKKVSSLITGSLIFTAVGAVILCLVWVLKVGGYGGLKTDNGTWHFVLMTLFIISTGIGATSFRIFTSLPRHIVKLIHATSLTFAFAVSTVALYSIFYFHDLKSIPNMYTLHSWLGLAFVILFGLQLCGGLFSFLFPLVSPATRTWILPYHRASGIVILAAIGMRFISVLYFIKMSSKLPLALSESMKNWYSKRQSTNSKPPLGSFRIFLERFCSVSVSSRSPFSFDPSSGEKKTEVLVQMHRFNKKLHKCT